jgi:Cytochrome oxidase c assembly
VLERSKTEDNRRHRGTYHITQIWTSAYQRTSPEIFSSHIYQCPSQCPFNNNTSRSPPRYSRKPIHPSIPPCKMPRSAADATRFTATMPHAHSKSPHISASPRTTSSPNRPKETPQEKVARLKAAARRAKAGNISTFDRIVVRGRVWADRAHRIVTLSLVGLTGSSFLLTPSTHLQLTENTD